MLNLKNNLNVLILIILISYTSVFAKTITVNQSGNGNYKKINDAISAAAVGDIIDISPGIYIESIEIGFSLTLQGSGPNFSTINATDLNSHALDIKSTNDNVNTIQIFGLRIVSRKNGINISNKNNHIVVKNCVISDCEYGIHNNSLKANKIDIINNTIVNNRVGITTGIVDGMGGAGTFFIIKGNIISDNLENGIYIRSSFHIVKSYYNNFFNNLSGDIGKGAAVDLDYQNNINVLPKFLNSSVGVYILSSNSPCINAGIIGGSYQDPDGSRNDIGAYAGPNSSMFWPYPIDGPIVKTLFVNPPSVPRGGQISIQVEGLIR